jgi:hypothetical protein
MGSILPSMSATGGISLQMAFIIRKGYVTKIINTIHSKHLLLSVILT